MIVCVCRNVSERGVAEVVRAGGRTVADVARATGAGTSCGSCRETIEAMIARLAPCRSERCAGCPRAAPARPEAA